MTAEAALKPRDFASSQEVRWCPGCGNYSVIKAVQKTLADDGCNPENTVFVSGIGCSSRFPYYMETYGFHTIHGRAAAVATGVKIANPELDVWVVSGDGDSLAIGGNHLLHLLRRNVDVTYLLLNNEIYGLTKGQASPTSRQGTLSPTSPNGTLDAPVHPAGFALGAGGHFVARAVDALQHILSDTIARAHGFRGASFVEVLQNCLVFNDGVFADVEDKKRIDETLLVLKHGEPMLFGQDKDKGIRFNPKSFALEVVSVGAGGVAVDDLLVHDETNRGQALLLAELRTPLPVGVLYAAPDQTFVGRQPAPQAELAKAAERLGAAMASGHTWRVD